MLQTRRKHRQTPRRYLVSKGACLHVKKQFSPAGVRRCPEGNNERQASGCRNSSCDTVWQPLRDSRGVYHHQRSVQVLLKYIKSRIEDFCKEYGLWMNTRHPNVLGLLGFNINPRNETLSMILELMENGNIMDYLHANGANGIRLV